MALPTIKIACSNGHFQESLQNYGDRGTWTTAVYDTIVAGSTVLEDDKANWVVDEWIGYYVVFDTGGTPAAVEITDNSVNTITVAGDYSAQASNDYRIAGGVTGTCTANPSATSTIIVTGITNKWGDTVDVEVNEFVNMKIVPDKLDGTEYTITANTGATGASIITISDSSSKSITASTCEIGRGTSTTLYPESLNISAELNEPKQLTATVVYDIVGTNKFEQEKDIDNPLMLGSTVRVSETTGDKILSDGHIQDAPTTIDAENRMIDFVAYDKLAILDYTLIPGTTIEDSGQLPTFGFTKQTPLLESGAAGWESENKIYQTKAFEDYSFVPQPFAYAGAVNSNGTYATRTSGGATSGTTLEPDSGTPFDTDLIKPGAVVINTTTKEVTHIESVTDSDTIVCTDSIWTAGDEYVILSKNWQVGTGIESDADYTTNAGWQILGRTRQTLEAPLTSGESDSDSTRVYVGQYNTTTTATDDVFMGFSGRAWALLIHNDYVELVHYNGYLYDFSQSQYYLNAYNTTPATDRNTRGDLTNAWDTSSGSYLGRQWASGSYFVEIFPNRFGGDAPKIYAEDSSTPVPEIGVVASEGVVKMSEGEDKWDGQDELYCHQFSYDGDARSASPDKGTTSTATDITDIVQTAITGLNDASASNEDIISKSKMTGGAGLLFNTTDSENTGIKINTYSYEAFGGGESPINPKQLITKLADDSGLLYDLSYDGNDEKVTFKPLSQKALASADITLSAGSVTSLTRERDISDVYTAMMMQVQLPDQNYFAPKNIIQYGCNFSTASVPKNDTQQAGFDSNSYVSGSSIPDYFWDITHLRGLGPDVENWGSAVAPANIGENEPIFYQSLWKKCEWKEAATSPYRNKRINSGGEFGIPTLSDDGNETPLHLMTLWFRGGIALDIEKFSFLAGFAGDGDELNGGIWRVEVSTDVDLSDPLGTGTWERFNDNSVSIKGSSRGGVGGKRVTLNKCQVNSVKAIRILALNSPYAQPGWWGEGRELLRQTDASNGYKTYGYSNNGDSAGETFTQEDDWWSSGTREPKWNDNRQDAWGWSRSSWSDYRIGNKQYYGTSYAKTAFQNAIDNTDLSGGADTERAGYVQLGNFLKDFEIQGVGKKALFVRTTKNQSSIDNVERLAFSPSYKKTASMGYKTNAVPLENFSFSEAQGLGQQFLDDKLRRFQARDYSLDGLSPFVNSNNIPQVGQTIAIADDTQGTVGSVSFSGILTQYEFTMDAEGARFDFRLEDYDRNNTAQYIQAG